MERQRLAKEREVGDIVLYFPLYRNEVSFKPTTNSSLKARHLVLPLAWPKQAVGWYCTYNRALIIVQERAKQAKKRPAQVKASSKLVDLSKSGEEEGVLDNLLECLQSGSALQPARYVCSRASEQRTSPLELVFAPPPTEIVICLS